MAEDGFIGFLSETIFLCPDYWYHRVNNYWDCFSIEHYLMNDENCSKMTLRDCNTCLIDFNHLATYCLSSIQIFYKLCQSFGGDAPQALFSSSEGLSSCSPENMRFWILRFISDQASATAFSNILALGIVFL